MAFLYNIADIAFEQIRDNYYWGRYGDFKVIIDISTGYINAAKLCKLATNLTGVRHEFAEWEALGSSQKIKKAVSSSTGIPVDALTAIPNELPNEIRGTFVHPDLIPHVAAWASPVFAVKVSKIVNAHFVREARELLRVKDDRIDQLIKETKEHTAKIENQSAQIQELLGYAKEQRNETKIVKQELATASTKLDVANTKLVDVSTKLEIVIEQRVPPEGDSGLNQSFCVFRKPGTDSYKMTRRQNRSAASSIKRCREQGFTELICRIDNPNPINIGSRLRSAFPAALGSVKTSTITLLPGKTAAELRDHVIAMNEEKKNI